ncbi:glycosyl hydrolase family 61-domain-containing protein [Pterulicium gracile]|uniref:AA9 family lytic polysaccharide monooxygenase n=1 Tax=Pterulicium gracile TaxID=1884261 RepID=A0A5C3QID7_9AGAR|nr:glycosyl hydrolase family 61-domain-containing protein [Pterula gracilis]
MKLLSSLVTVATLAHTVSAHYIFFQATTGSQTGGAAIRQPRNNSPVESATSNDLRCNSSPSAASTTASMAAGSSFSFKLDNTFYHPGPGAVYLGQVPSGQTAANWDGSGANWFKIAEYGAKFNPFGFVLDGQSTVSGTLPSSIQAGEYLLRVEQIGLHVAGAPQWYISCAQINVTGGGSANPPKVSIPGHVSASDPGLSVNIYYPVPTSYKVPGPAVWRG